MHSEVNTHHVLISNKIRVELLNGVSKHMFYVYGLILLLKLKKAENVTCLNWKFPVLSDVKIKDRAERHVVAECALYCDLERMNLSQVIGHYSRVFFMPLHRAKRKHTATNAVVTHTAARAMVFQTADVNGPNPKSVSSTPFHN